VVDRAPVALAPPLTDDVVGGNLKDVERGFSSDVHNLHSGVVVPGGIFGPYFGAERILIKSHGPIHICGEGTDVIEARRNGHLAFSSLNPRVGPADPMTDVAVAAPGADPLNRSAR
jgi:hypothetical protein